MKKTDKLSIKLIVLSTQLNYLFFKIPEIIKTKGFKYFIQRSSFIIKQVIFKLLGKASSFFKNQNQELKNKNITKPTQEKNIKSGLNGEIFIRNLKNYKIYKMENMYFAFPSGEKINFKEKDYALNDSIIKDYSVDAVETKIIEID